VSDEDDSAPPREGPPPHEISESSLAGDLDLDLWGARADGMSDREPGAPIGPIKDGDSDEAHHATSEALARFLADRYDSELPSSLFPRGVDRTSPRTPLRRDLDAPARFEGALARVQSGAVSAPPREPSLLTVPLDVEDLGEMLTTPAWLDESSARRSVPVLPKAPPPPEVQRDLAARVRTPVPSSLLPIDRLDVPQRRPRSPAAGFTQPYPVGGTPLAADEPPSPSEPARESALAPHTGAPTAVPEVSTEVVDVGETASDPATPRRESSPSRASADESLDLFDSQDAEDPSSRTPSSASRSSLDLQASADAPPLTDLGGSRGTPPPKGAWRRAGLGTAIVVVAAGALWLSRTPAPERPASEISAAQAVPSPLPIEAPTPAPAPVDPEVPLPPLPRPSVHAATPAPPVEDQPIETQTELALPEEADGVSLVEDTDGPAEDLPPAPLDRAMVELQAWEQIVDLCRQRDGVEARRLFRALRGAEPRTHAILGCRDLGIDLQVESAGPTASEYLEMAQDAYAGGDLGRAYLLARNSSRESRTPEALMLMGNAACDLKDEEKALVVYRMLIPRDKRKLARYCTRSALRLR